MNLMMISIPKKVELRTSFLRILRLAQTELGGCENQDCPSQDVALSCKHFKHNYMVDS